MKPLPLTNGHGRPLRFSTALKCPNREDWIHADIVELTKPVHPSDTILRARSDASYLNRPNFSQRTCVLLPLVGTTTLVPPTLLFTTDLCSAIARGCRWFALLFPRRSMQASSPMPKCVSTNG
jgi:hypothetical protein